MLIIKFLISIFTIFFSGYIILRFLNFKEDNLLESIVLSFGLGSGFIGMTMFFLSLTAIAFSLWLIVLPQIILFLIFIRKNKIYFLQTLNKKIYVKWNFSIFESILLCFIIFEVFFILLEAGSLPFLSWDAWCTWGFKAKMLFIDKTFNFREWLKSPNIPHLNYPLLLSLLETYIYIFLGRIYEPFARVFCSFYFIGLVFLLYSSIRKEFSRKLSLLFCFFFSTTPILLKESISGYADVPLAFYVSVAVINFWHYMKKKHNPRLWLSCIFLGFAMWIKNEGMSFWLAVFLSIIFMMLMAPELFKNKAKIILTNIFIPWFIFSPWIALRLILHIQGERSLGSINTLFGLIIERGGYMLKALTLELIRVSHWNIYGIIFLCSLIIIFTIDKRNKIKLFLLFVVFFHSLFFISSFIFCPGSLREMIAWCSSSIYRPLLQFYPIALFFAAQCIGALEQHKKSLNLKM